MPSVVHVVVTANFAGVERYVCDTAGETARRGWETTVVGGDPAHLPAALDRAVRWLPGATAIEALRALTRLGPQSVCHAHMTVAEAVAVASRSRHRAAIVSTRHFAARRGSSLAGRGSSPVISASLDREIAVSDFVARRLERPPDAVIANGVRSSGCLWRPASRTVLVLQRLESEKDTLTALRAWLASGLADEGWSLRVVGEGSERSALEAWAKSEHAPRVAFAGWSRDVPGELAAAGVLLAPGAVDSFGLAVLEAMAAGVPVVACGAGGHLETVGLLPDAPMFPPRDAGAAATALRSLLPEEARAGLSAAGRRLVEESFTVSRHVDRLLPEYETALRRTPRPRLRRRAGSGRQRSGEVGLAELVVCSLEGWDEVWRRNQFLTDILLRRNPGLKVLFVEPAADPLYDLSSRRRPLPPRLHRVSDDGRLRTLRPLKPAPRRLGPLTDSVLCRQVAAAARLVGLSRPTLWINDATYAPLIAATGWPSVYDVTDDWLQAPLPSRELDRLRRLDELALWRADEVVVCSDVLAESRGERRNVSVVRNGVDVEHFRRPRPRPDDLPGAPTTVYVGSLHDSRIDVPLVADTARAVPHASLVFVGPDSLGHDSHRLLAAAPNVRLLGPRPYADVPAYLQHADVVIVPHLVSAFTESLDPIKAYECLAIDTPTVATPVAGFRDLAEELTVVGRDTFPARVAETLADPSPRAHRAKPAAWVERALEFERVLLRARERRIPPSTVGAPG
jgi:glycosyltransferase involved in cell wall biosynthesis